VAMSSLGDELPDASLSEIGGKGAFIKTLESALLANEIDVAVHSLKDVTSQQPESLTLSGFLKAESCADVWLSPSGVSIQDLSEGARIGTGSLRRQAILKSIRPDLEVRSIRGNVQTRIEGMAANRLDGILLSEAGVLRLGLGHLVTQRLDPIEFVPAPGQGVITLETRVRDAAIGELCRQISDPTQAKLSQIERHILVEVGFDCRMPLGLFAWSDGAQVVIEVFLADTRLNHAQRMQYRPRDLQPETLQNLGKEIKDHLNRIESLS